MIPDVGRSSAPSSAELAARSLEQARTLSMLRSLGTTSGTSEPPGGSDAGFRLRLIEALGQYAEAAKRAGPGTTAGPSAPAPASPAASTAARSPAPDPARPAEATSGQPPAAAAGETAHIQQVADRHGIDREFLVALRKVENGRPGREFGVLSVPAPTFTDQARVAAETVRRNVERYEATGQHAVDPATGRYTEGFIRFFSGRYAPVGAENDPTNLNAHHARNLIRRYADLAGRG